MRKVNAFRNFCFFPLGERHFAGPALFEIFTVIDTVKRLDQSGPESLAQFMMTFAALPIVNAEFLYSVHFDFLF